MWLPEGVARLFGTIMNWSALKSAPKNSSINWIDSALRHNACRENSIG